MVSSGPKRVKKKSMASPLGLAGATPRCRRVNIVWTTIVQTIIMASMDTPPQRQQSRRFDSPEQEAYLNLWRTYDRLRAVEDGLFGAPRPDRAAVQRPAAAPRGPPRPAADAGLGRPAGVAGAGHHAAARPAGDSAAWSNATGRPATAASSRSASLPPASPCLAGLDAEVRACNARQLGHLDRGDLRKLNDLLRKARRPHEAPDSDWL